MKHCRSCLIYYMKNGKSTLNSLGCFYSYFILVFYTSGAFFNKKYSVRVCWIRDGYLSSQIQQALVE